MKVLALFAVLFLLYCASDSTFANRLKIGKEAETFMENEGGLLSALKKSTGKGGSLLWKRSSLRGNRFAIYLEMGIYGGTSLQLTLDFPVHRDVAERNWFIKAHEAHTGGKKLSGGSEKEYEIARELDLSNDIIGLLHDFVDNETEVVGRKRVRLTAGGKRELILKYPSAGEYQIIHFPVHPVPSDPQLHYINPSEVLEMQEYQSNMGQVSALMLNIFGAPTVDATDDGLIHVYAFEEDTGPSQPGATPAANGEISTTDTHHTRAQRH